MTTKVVVRQGGFSAAEVDYANAFTGRKGTPFFEGNTPLLNFAHRFANGEAAQGQFKFVDPDGELTSTNLTLRPWAEVKLTEDASGDELILGWMRLVTGDVQRRSVYIGGYDIDHNPQMMDINLDVRGIPFSGPWSRPAETDYERLQALQARKLNGSSSTGRHRDSTTITVDSFANGHLVEHDTPVDLEAKVYPEGTEVSEVIADIAEQAGKEWAIVPHHKDGATHKCLLYMDQEDLDRYQSPVRISDQYADWDPDDETAPTFEPHWMQGAGRESDFQTVASGIVSIWGGTDDDPRVVTVENDEAETDAEVWWTVINDAESKNETQATRRATWEMKDRRRPQDSMKPSILVKASQAHLVGAGMAIQTKSVVMNSGPDKGSWVWRRVAECRVEPAANGLYWLHLNLERPRFSGKSGGSAQPGSTSPKPRPPCTPADPGGVGDEVTLADAICESPDGVGDSRCGGQSCFYSASGAGTTASTITPGTYYTTLQAGTAYSWYTPGKFQVRIWDSSTILPDILETVWEGILPHGHYGGGVDDCWGTVDGVFTVPTGYDRLEFELAHRTGGWIVQEDSHHLYEFTEPSEPVEDDPDCVQEGEDGDSPFYARSDDPRFDADDQHLVSMLRGRVTNNSGGTLVEGDVVIADTTFDGRGVTTTTVAATTDARVGVITEGGDDGEGVTVLWEGTAGFVNDGAATSADGDYLYTSTTAGAAGVSATRSEGAVGRIIRDASGDPDYVLWWGVPDSGSGGSGSIDVSDETTTVSPTSVLTFAGPDFEVTDTGGGQAFTTLAPPSAITPTQLAANTDDWAPTGLSSADIVRATTDASRELRGLTAPSDARAIILANVGSNDLVLTHDAGTSTAGNRFFLPNSTSMTLDPNTAVLLFYDLASSRWRTAGGVGTATGSAESVLPLTAVVDGEPVLVWDENNSLIGAA